MSASKASLLECLEDVHPTEEHRPAVDVMIVNGAAAVHIVRPGAAKNFWIVHRKCILALQHGDAADCSPFGPCL